MSNEEKKNPLSNLLGNAKQSAIGLEFRKEKMNARKCPQCSAARPEDTDIRVCNFCGYVFMNEEVIIKKDNPEKE